MSLDMRVTRAIRLGERVRLGILILRDLIYLTASNEDRPHHSFGRHAFGQRAGNGNYYSRPTAAYDPRQFQFGLKLNF